MDAEERRSQILDLVRARGFVRVTDLVADFQVSSMTIRRDLAVLSGRGVIEKVHGGGVVGPATSAPPEQSLGPADPDHQRASGIQGQSADGKDAGTHIGIVVPSGHYYFPIVVGGARRVLDARSVRRALAISGYDPEQDRVLVQQLLDAGSTGLLLAPSVALGDENAERIDWLFELPVPVVLVERTVTSADRGAALCSVRTDHELGCERAVRHLARLGHRGVALVTQGTSQTKSRVINGWQHAVVACGLDSALSPLVATSPQANLDLWPTNDAIRSVLDELQEAGATAALVHSDQTALPLLHHARMRGWRIPQDLSVIAYDNEIAEMADPPLTAVSPPKAWVGQAAAELLMELVAGAGSGPVRHVVAEPELVVRRSTAAPRTTPLPEPLS
ncbi:substrate-binding domain-containing protein [Actinopolymorpha sp. B17G11]|uniref:substrate-binding domain-containing protein n=1 Tax=unclassified Actinopolymorpha TaxID=2627063 RepID=UPI0032D8C691